MAYLLAFSILLAPLYVWRFSIAGIPTNFLMLWLAVVIAIGTLWVIWKGEFKRYVTYSLGLDTWLAIGVYGFSLAGVISLFVGGLSLPKLAQWVVLFVEPVKFFFLARYLISKQPETRKYMRAALYVLIAAAGVLAVVQYFTLATLAPAWWGNAAEPKRAIAFFAHPNAFALFVTPVLAFLIPDVVVRLQELFGAHKQTFYRNLAVVIAWISGGVGLLLSLSRGGWLGLLAAAGVYAVLIASKKYFYGMLVAAVLLAGVVAVVPNLRYRVLLPFHGEKSTVSRFSLWQTGWKMIADSPVTGKGINGFADNWDTYNSDPNLDHYNFPHNITLNFWTDTGLLGLLSFGALLLYGLWKGFIDRANVWKSGLVLFIVALVIHGLIDIPYLKNDLAFCFWVLYALALA